MAKKKYFIISEVQTSGYKLWKSLKIIQMEK